MTPRIKHLLGTLTVLLLMGAAPLSYALKQDDALYKTNIEIGVIEIEKRGRYPLNRKTYKRAYVSASTEIPPTA